MGVKPGSSPLQQPELPRPPACRAHGSHEGHSRPLRSPHRKPQGRDSLSPFSLNPHIQRRTPSISPVFTRPSVQHLQGRMMLGSTRCWLNPREGHHFTAGAISSSSSAIGEEEKGNTGRQLPNLSTVKPGQHTGTPPMLQHCISVGFGWPAATSQKQQAPRDTTYPLVLIYRPCLIPLASPKFLHRNTESTKKAIGEEPESIQTSHFFQEVALKLYRFSIRHIPRDL